MPRFQVVLAPAFSYDTEGPGEGPAAAQEVVEQLSRMRVEITRKQDEPMKLSLVWAGPDASPLNIHPMKDVHCEDLQWIPIRITPIEMPEEVEQAPAISP